MAVFELFSVFGTEYKPEALKGLVSSPASVLGWRQLNSHGLLRTFVLISFPLILKVMLSVVYS